MSSKTYFKIRTLKQGSLGLAKKTLVDIIHLIDHGNYFEAKSEINQLEDEQLSNEEKLLIDLQNFRILNGLHNYSETLKDIDVTIEVVKENNMEKELIQLLTLKSAALLFTKKHEESHKYANKGLELIEKMSTEKQQEFIEEKGYLLVQIGNTYLWQGKFEESLDYAKKTLKIFEKIDFRLGIGKAFLLMGLVNFGISNYTDSLEFFSEALAIFIDLKIIHLMLDSYYYLGRIYYVKGQIHQSLAFSAKLLPLVEKYNDDYRIGVYLLNSAILKSEIGEYELAEKNALSSVQHFEKINREDITYTAYYRVFQIKMNQNKVSEAKKYFEKLQEIRGKYPKITNLYDVIRLAEAQLLINTKNKKEMEKAKVILNDVIVNFGTREDNAFEARYYLCNILLQEYLDSSDVEILEKLNKLTSEILEFGIKGQLVGYRVKANHIRLLIVWIQHQHLPNEIKHTEVEQLILKVHNIAEKHGLSIITQEFTEQQEKLLQQKQSLEDFIKAYYLANNQDSFKL